jgi:hypothetical protein
VSAAEEGFDDEYETWRARKARNAAQEVKRARRIQTDDLVPEIALKGQRWTLDDKSAGALAEGRCFRISLVLRSDAVWEFRDGRRWRTTLLEVEGITAPDPSVEAPPEC